MAHLLKLNKIPYKTFHFACPLTSTWSRKLCPGRERRAIPVAPTVVTPSSHPPPPALQHPLPSSTLGYYPPWQSPVHRAPFPGLVLASKPQLGLFRESAPYFPQQWEKAAFSCTLKAVGLSHLSSHVRELRDWRSCVCLEPEHMVLKGEELGVMKWLTCNMKRTQPWKPCLGFLLVERFTAQHPDPSQSPAQACLQQRNVACLLNLREDRPIWNKTPLNTESTLKHSPSPPAERFLKRRSAISEHGSPGGRHRVAIRLPQSQSPFSVGQQPAPGSPGSWREAKGKLGFLGGCAPQHCLTWLWTLSWMQTKTQHSHSLCGSSIHKKKKKIVLV